MFIGRTDAKAETPILWPPHVKSWLIGKDPDAGKDWGQEEKGMTEDEMAGWHHRLDGQEFGWTLGVGDGQGGLACWNSWGHKELDMTEWLNWIELNWEQSLAPKQQQHHYLKTCEFKCLGLLSRPSDSLGEWGVGVGGIWKSVFSQALDDLNLGSARAACGPNPTHHLFSWIKFYRNTVTYVLSLLLCYNDRLKAIWPMKLKILYRENFLTYDFKWC